MTSLAEEFPKEQQRVRELLPLYDSIPTGAFGAAMPHNADDPDDPELYRLAEVLGMTANPQVMRTTGEQNEQ